MADEEKDQEPIGERSAADNIRELIVGPDKREIEAQLRGMSDMFTKMLVENRKQYDEHVREMKQMFVQVIEENRHGFEAQLQDIKESIPKTVERKFGELKEQEYLFVQEADGTRTMAEHTSKYSRIEAVRELVAGPDLTKLYKHTEQVQERIVATAEQRKARIEAMADEVREELQASSRRVETRMAEIFEQIDAKIKQNKDDIAERQYSAAVIAEAAEKLKR